MIAACIAIAAWSIASPDSSPPRGAGTAQAAAVSTAVTAADSLAVARAPDSLAAAGALPFRLVRDRVIELRAEGFGVGVEPGGVALDAFDHVYVSDRSRSRVLRYDRDGSRLDEAGGLGDDAGQLRRPGQLATAGAAGMAVLDEENRRVLVVDLFGRFAGVRVDLDTAAPDPQHTRPVGLASDRAGALYVADAEQDRVLVFDATGARSRVVTGYGAGLGPFRGLAGVAVGRRGDLVVAERVAGRIRRFDASGALAASWRLPARPGGERVPIAVDDSLRVAVADAAGHSLWLFDARGGLLARSDALDRPTALFFHKDGSLWVAERGRIARFTVTPRARE